MEMRFHNLSKRFQLHLLMLVTLLQYLPGQNLDHYPELDKIVIPFELKQDLILVDCKLDGKIPMKFIWDTGAENTILFDRLYAEIIGATYDMRIPIVGSSLKGERFALVSRKVIFTIDELPPVPLDILVLEEYEPKLREYLGTEIHGILGSSFFRNYIVEINYRKQKIYLYKYESFPTKRVKDFSAHPIIVDRGKPYLSSTVTLNTKDSVELDLLMDTGAGMNLLIHSNTHSDLQLPDSVIRGELGVGVSGAVSGYIGRVHTFALGPIEYKGMIAAFQDIDTAIHSRVKIRRNGIIGNTMLKRFRVIWDFPREVVYLKPERNARDEFVYDRSGMSIVAYGPQLHQYQVQKVWPGSPADEAGLKSGDVLLKFQCWPIDFFNLSAINRTLKKRPGKTIRIKVKRGNEKLKFKFRLRDLI